MCRRFLYFQEEETVRIEWESPREAGWSSESRPDVPSKIRTMHARDGRRVRNTDAREDSRKKASMRWHT